jgi:hypothetical protein
MQKVFLLMQLKLELWNPGRNMHAPVTICLGS